MVTHKRLAALCRPFAGEVYRAHNPKWAYRPLSGQGAALEGGRFNARGTPALYTSRSQLTAIAEAQQGFPYKPVILLVTYQCEFNAVLDLTDPSNRDAAQVQWHELCCDWKLQIARAATADSWTLAARLIAAGITAIQVPSFAPNDAGGTNVVFWRWNDRPDRCIRVLDYDDRLPRNSASWS